MAKGKFEDLTGKRFGRLLVTSRGPNQRQQPTWNCRCDCGAGKTMFGGNLRSGYSLSCGCLRAELRSAQVRHGAATRGGVTAEYYAWQTIHRMCLPDYVAPHLYHGRGIRVSPAWDDFATFLADMGVRPPGHTLGRLDDGDDFAFGNCAWVPSARVGRKR